MEQLIWSCPGLQHLKVHFSLYASTTAHTNRLRHMMGILPRCSVQVQQHEHFSPRCLTTMQRSGSQLQWYLPTLSLSFSAIWNTDSKQTCRICSMHLYYLTRMCGEGQFLLRQYVDIAYVTSRFLKNLKVSQIYWVFSANKFRSSLSLMSCTIIRVSLGRKHTSNMSIISSWCSSQPRCSNN